MANLYYTNAAGGEFFYPSEWSNVLNWNTEPDGSGDTPTGIPWVDGYFDYDLRYGDSFGGTVYWATPASVSISPTTGSCYLDVHMRDYCTIDGGNWYGTFTNQGQIVGGNFYGVSSNRNNNQSFDSYGYIYGGTFYGNNFFNDSKIYGGVFLGSNFTNEENGFGTSIFGGEYNINGFTNVGGSIDYPNITISENGTPYSGSWQGQIWSAGVWVSIEILPTALYYTNAGGDGLWSTLQNWNTSADGLGAAANSIPWTTSATSNLNLHLSSPELTAPSLNGLMIGGNGQDFSITATCDQKIAQEIIDNGYDIVAQAVL